MQPVGVATVSVSGQSAPCAAANAEIPEAIDDGPRLGRDRPRSQPTNVADEQPSRFKSSAVFVVVRQNTCLSYRRK